MLLKTQGGLLRAACKYDNSFKWTRYGWHHTFFSSLLCFLKKAVLFLYTICTLRYHVLWCSCHNIEIIRLIFCFIFFSFTNWVMIQSEKTFSMIYSHSCRNEVSNTFLSYYNIKQNFHLLGDAPGKMLLKEVVVLSVWKKCCSSQFIIGHWGIIGFYGGGSCFLEGGNCEAKEHINGLTNVLTKITLFSSSSLGAINDHDIKPKKATQAW